MGDLYRPHRVMRAGGHIFNVLSACFFVWRKRSDSSDTGVAGVPVSDGVALVIEHSRKKTKQREKERGKECRNAW